MPAIVQLQSAAICQDYPFLARADQNGTLWQKTMPLTKYPFQRLQRAQVTDQCCWDDQRNTESKQLHNLAARYPTSRQVVQKKSMSTQKQSNCPVNGN